jgi:uncharacterized protein YbbK (DUF523 family)
MADNIKIGISSCLLGRPVRYDGENKQDHFLINTFGRYVKWVPVCPEVEYGMPVPREEMRLYGNSDYPQLITVNTKVDHTKGLHKWIDKKIKELENENLCGFIFKSRSPSCGPGEVNVYYESGKRVINGVGLFADAFIRHFPCVPFESEVRLHDPIITETFIKKIFALNSCR